MTVVASSCTHPTLAMSCLSNMASLADWLATMSLAFVVDDAIVDWRLLFHNKALFLKKKKDLVVQLQVLPYLLLKIDDTRSNGQSTNSFLDNKEVTRC